MKTHLVKFALDLHWQTQRYKLKRSIDSIAVSIALKIEANLTMQIIICRFVHYISFSRPFPSCSKPLFQSEAKCKAIDTNFILMQILSQIPRYEHLIITNSFLCPWGKKALSFSLNSTRFKRGYPVNTNTFCGTISVHISVRLTLTSKTSLLVSRFLFSMKEIIDINLLDLAWQNSILYFWVLKRKIPTRRLLIHKVLVSCTVFENTSLIDSEESLIFRRITQNQSNS